MDPNGKTKLFPYNVVTTFYWVVDEAAGPRPASLELLKRALYGDADARRRLLLLLDANRDGRLEDDERYLPTADAVDQVRALLVRAGANNPRPAGEMQPYGIHHGMAPARFALRDCDACHRSESRLSTPFELARRAPFGVVPHLLGDANVATAFRIATEPRGPLYLIPDTTLAGLRLFGLSRRSWLDWAGLSLVGLVLAGVLGHATLRFWSTRKGRSP